MATPAVILGFAGALPFVAGTVGFVSLPEPYCVTALTWQKYYGATILSFLGAVHWGLALQTTIPARQAWRSFGYAVTPSLISWLALMVPGNVLGLGTLLGGLGGALVYDLTTLRKIAPPWYLSLRVALSTIAMTSIALNIHASGVFRASKAAREAAMTEAERKFAQKLKDR